MQIDSSTRVLQDLGRIARDARLLVRLSQQEVERRSGVSQSRISRIERGECRSLRVAEIDRVFVTLGVRYRLDATLPPVASLVRDAVHVRCVTYVQRRLEREGWLVRREVEIGGDRSRGWIDVLAFHPVTRILLIIEIKTEFLDIGAIERTLNWYFRESTAAAARIGWRPVAVHSALLLLATGANDRAIRSSRSALELAMPDRSAGLRAVLETPIDRRPRRFIAAIDPRSRRRSWLMPTVVDGRRSPAPYADYIDAARQLEAKRAP